MKKWYGLLFVLLCSMNLFGCRAWDKEKESVNYTYTEEGDFEVIQLGNVSVKIEIGSLDEDIQNQVTMQIEKAADAARSFLGSDAAAESVICYLHGEDGSTYVYGNEIHVFYPGNRNIPYILLLTQAETGVYNVPDWLKMGLGAYAADIYGESMLDTYARTLKGFESDPAENAEGEAVYYHLDQIAGQLLQSEKYAEAFRLLDMTEGILGYEDNADAYEYRGVYCICAGSFVKYIDEQYGREVLMQLYKGSSMEELTGTGREEVLQRWLNELRKYG